MESGSVRDVTDRLKLWSVQREQGLARVEWDSAFTRRDVVDQLRFALEGTGTALVEIELAPGEAAEQTLADLLEKLRAAHRSVVSITGIEWAFPEHGNRLDTLIALSFQRETLASFPVRQIWWVPSSLTERFILAVPDLDSWFQLRLHLTEVPAHPPQPEPVQGRTVSVDAARFLAWRFWERQDAARQQNIPEQRIWLELAAPAVDALIAAGLIIEANAILAGVNVESATLEPGEPERLAATERAAGLLSQQGQFSRARQLQESVLVRRVQLFGDHHPDSLLSMNNLASIFRAQGDYIGARVLQQRVLEARIRLVAWGGARRHACFDERFGHNNERPRRLRGGTQTSGACA